MKWFQVKEQSAGRKRLILTWYLYKIFGKNILYVIAFLMSVITFIFAPSVRKYSEKYFSAVQDSIGLKPNVFNCFKHILAYADSLADKILVYCGEFNPENIRFEDDQIKTQLFEDIENGDGVFFISNHVGNIEVLQSFFFSKVTNPDFRINIFLSKKQSQIFNGFLSDIKKEIPLKMVPVEDIGFETGIELKENLTNGVVFMAGDRLAQNNDTKTIKTKIFNHDINLPLGTFKLAKLMEVPVYFISALREDDGKYNIVLEKCEDLSESGLVEKFAGFMQNVTQKAPYQFFHFYDFWG